MSEFRTPAYTSRSDIPGFCRRLIRAKAVVMATGGCGRLHIQGFMTTNHHGATADGIVLGYRAGVPVCFLHTVQYHPTGIVFPEQAEGILITEKFRGWGANLVDIEGNQFVNEADGRVAPMLLADCTDPRIRERQLTAHYVGTLR